MSTFNLDIKLPTLGRIYNPPLPEIITIRALTARDEKVIFGSWSTKSIDILLQKCIVEPKNLDISKLISADKLAILIHLRMLTYGEEYAYSVKCPACGKKQKLIINMQTDYAYNELKAEDDFYPMHVKLPVCGDELEVYALNQDELEESERWIKKFLKNANLEGDPSMLLRYAYMIKKINGDDSIPREQKYGYIESLHGKDFAYLQHRVEDFNLGFDFNVIKPCKFCGEDMEVYAGLGPEFFRSVF